MDYLKADSLQQLHAMHNLASLLGPNGALPSGVAPTLRDASLQKDADRIREVNYQSHVWSRSLPMSLDIELFNRYFYQQNLPTQLLFPKEKLIIELPCILSTLLLVSSFRASVRHRCPAEIYGSMVCQAGSS